MLKKVDFLRAVVFSTTAPSPSAEPPPPSNRDLLLGLEAWEVGLVGANAVVVLVLLLCVLTLCVVRRKPRNHQQNQHLPLKEIGESVDFSSWS